MLEAVQRRVRRRENVDVELLKESTGAELRALEFARDDVVVLVGVSGAEALGESKVDA
jgi:hypothetical protein